MRNSSLQILGHGAPASLSFYIMLLSEMSSESPSNYSCHGFCICIRRLHQHDSACLSNGTQGGAKQSKHDAVSLSHQKQKWHHTNHKSTNTNCMCFIWLFSWWCFKGQHQTCCLSRTYVRWPLTLFFVRTKSEVAQKWWQLIRHGPHQLQCTTLENQNIRRSQNIKAINYKHLSASLVCSVSWVWCHYRCEVFCLKCHSKALPNRPARQTHKETRLEWAPLRWEGLRRAHGCRCLTGQ